MKLKYWLLIINSKTSLKIIGLFKNKSALYQKEVARKLSYDERNIRESLIYLCKINILTRRKKIGTRIILYELYPSLIVAK